MESLSFFPPFVLGCGFCMAGPTALVFPMIPTWATVFLIWCVFRHQYDSVTTSKTALWLCTAVLVFITGSISSIALWSIFLGYWTAQLVLRMKHLKRDVQSLKEQIAGGEDAGLLRKHAACAACLRFHRHLVTLLALGLLASGLRNYAYYLG
ncbi:MAG: hypothetical protein L6R28_00215 [Planctomycetes bacterium]|nr:hypothetical protein [Planctomycetota bacterium]